MDSVLVTIHHNDPEKFNDYLEDFRQYFSWILCEHECNNIQTSTTQVNNAQLEVGSKSHIFTNITMFNYIVPVRCNVKILSGRKSPAKGFVLVIIEIQKTNIIIPLWS